jgi:hypothetical protein
MSDLDMRFPWQRVHMKTGSVATDIFHSKILAQEPPITLSSCIVFVGQLLGERFGQPSPELPLPHRR